MDVTLQNSTRSSQTKQQNSPSILKKQVYPETQQTLQKPQLGGSTTRPTPTNAQIANNIPNTRIRSAKTPQNQLPNPEAPTLNVSRLYSETRAPDADIT
jgi:hypothetical protein